MYKQEDFVFVGKLLKGCDAEQSGKMNNYIELYLCTYALCMCMYVYVECSSAFHTKGKAISTSM